MSVAVPIGALAYCSPTDAKAGVAKKAREDGLWWPRALWHGQGCGRVGDHRLRVGGQLHCAGVGGAVPYSRPVLLGGGAHSARPPRHAPGRVLLNSLNSPPQLVEEHHKLVKRLLTYLIRAELGLHVALAALDTQPLGCVFCGFVAHCCYAALLPRYPGFRVLSPEFVGAVALCTASHLLWGNHFYNHTYQPLEHCGAFFVVAVWPAPFLIFLSFGTIDGGLPLGGPGERHGRSGAGLLALLGLRAGEGKREELRGGGGGMEREGSEGHQTQAYHGHRSY